MTEFKLLNYAGANGAPRPGILTGDDTVDFGDGNGVIDVLTGDGAWWWGPKN